MQTHTIDAITAVISLMAPLMFIPLGLAFISFLLKVVMAVGEERTRTEEAKPVPLKPSKAVRKMVGSVDGEAEPDWLEKLVRYEKQEVVDKKVKSSVEKMEKAFAKEYEQFQENFDAFKKLAIRTDGKLADIAERTDANPVMLNLAVGLSKQKELVLNMAQEILELRIQEDTATRAKKANELAEKMGKELVENKETTTIRNQARSVHEEVLHEILASKEATEEMKKRAEAMLPHFKSMSLEEEQVDMIRNDYELDLRTLEGILQGDLAKTKETELVN